MEYLFIGIGAIYAVALAVQARCCAATVNKPKVVADEEGLEVSLMTPQKI